MKAVGEAVKDGQSLQLSHSRVTHSLRCVGICPWGYVQNREDLIRTPQQVLPHSDGIQRKVSAGAAGSWTATYHVDPVVRHGKPVSLDPNHTHFILVDDGYRNKFRPQVADFRAKLERYIAAPVVNTNGSVLLALT